MFSERRIEILWCVSVDLLIYKAKRYPGNYWYNKHSAVMLHRDYALPTIQSLVHEPGAWTSPGNLVEMHILGPYPRPTELQSAVSQDLRWPLGTLSIKSTAVGAVPWTLSMKHATKRFMFFRSPQVHRNWHYYEFSCLVHHVMRSCFHQESLLSRASEDSSREVGRLVLCYEHLENIWPYTVYISKP